MKKYLAMALSLVMVLTLVFAVSVPVMAEGTSGDVVVYQSGFDNGTFKDGAGQFVSRGSGLISIVNDNGNNCMALTHNAKASDAIKWATATGIKVGGDSYVMGFELDFSPNLVLDKTKKYYIEMDAKVKSGVDVTIDKTFREAITQTTAGQYWPGFSVKSTDENGWSRFKSSALTGSNISKTDSQTGNFSYFYTKTWLSDYVVKAMVATKSYHGTGLGKRLDGAAYADLTDYSFEVDGTTYNVGSDCSGFGTETEKAAALQAYLTANPAVYYVDNVKVLADGLYYTNDTVSVGNNGSLKVITDGTGDYETFAAGQSGNITVNDIVDVVFEVTPDDGYEGYAIVDGAAKEIVDGKFTIPYNQAAIANDIVVGFKKESTTVTRVKTINFNDGSLSYDTSNSSSDRYWTPSFVSADGLLGATVNKKSGNVNKLTAGADANGNEYLSYAPYPHEIQETYSAYSTPRMTVRIGGTTENGSFNFATDRNYTVAFDIENTSSIANSAFPYVQWEATTWTSFVDGSTTSGKMANSSSGTFSKSVTANTRADVSASFTFPTVGSGVGDSYGPIKFVLVPQDNKNYAGEDYETVLAWRVMKMYGVQITETVATHLVTTDSGEGTISVSTESLNFPEDNVVNRVLADGEGINVEDNMSLEFTVTPPEGKVVETVKHYVNGLPEDIGKNTNGKYGIPNITTSSEIVITYIDNPAYVQNTFDYISLANNSTLLAEGATYEGEYVGVTGYKDGSEYDLTGSPFITLESDNEQVFTVANGKISTTDNYGFATITATYDNLEGEDVSATVMFQRSENKIVAGNPGSAYIVSGASGHIDGSNAYSYGHLESYDTYSCRTAYGTPRGLNWHTMPWRTMTAWFYDAGVGEQTENAQLWPFVKYYNAETGKYFVDQTGNLGVDVSNTESYIPNRLNAVPRTKGWHQATVTVNSSGQILKYIDGVLVDKINVSLQTWNGIGDSAPESNLEFRCSGRGIYSDFAITDYSPVKDEYDVEFVAENGAVSGSAVVAHGETAEYTLAADEGYDIPATVTVYDYAGLNTQTITVSNGKFSLKPSDDTIIKAVFTEKAAYEPSIQSTAVNRLGAYNKEITTPAGKKVTITSAAAVESFVKIDEGYNYEIEECGVELKKGEGKALKLKANSIIVDEGIYRIIAYGVPIVSDDDYSGRAYITFKDAQGQSKTVYGEWCLWENKKI